MPDPKIYKSTTPSSGYGTCPMLTFSGEQYAGRPILDTKVEIEAGTLCWITYNDKEAFAKELNDLITKYAI
jgi:hypothetical protein